ncbi:two-component regulator propeller domain-containing protein [Pontibacter sp. G13]|uniref:ligand-binding sensor domain-containing protein n=1 Tax=Pontibacter sp. G13 TaxID=3074898 RepID=UPI00288AABC3|nr:two-component regulator propeller domain-containing protein [Pontibacter sp. G13]WNJ20617.1 two-component regulator propeller domain-containing protein [Pontibacter sp. G13]
MAKSWIILLLLFAGTLIAQPDWTSRQFDYLGVPQGLSHSSVHCMVQDEHGFIWLGTEHGLNWYDGYRCRTFLPDNSPLTDGTVFSLLLDGDNLWIGTRFGGLNKLHLPTLTWESFVYDPENPASAPNYPIRALSRDGQGNLWIGSDGGGISQFHPDKQLFSHFLNGPEDGSAASVMDLKYDPARNAFWVGTGATGIHQFDLNRYAYHAFYPESGSPQLNTFRKSLLMDPAGNLWIGTDGEGLFRFNPRTQEFEQFHTQSSPALSSNLVMDVALSPHGEIVIATDGGGINALDPATRHISQSQYTPEQHKSLNTNAIYSLLYDEDDNLWAGTFNGGANAFKARKPSFEQYTQTPLGVEGLSHKSVLAMLEDRKGRIWMGTDGGGINLFHPEDGTFEHFLHDPKDPTSIPSNAITWLHQDQEGKIWMGTFSGGMAYIDPETYVVKRFEAQKDVPHKLWHVNVWTIQEGPTGKIWLGTLGEGLQVFDPETGYFEPWQRATKYVPGLQSLQIKFLHWDSQDRLWIGTDSDGIACWNSITRRLKHFRHDPSDPTSLSGDGITYITEDRKGQIWIGTSNQGLNLFQGEDGFRKIPEFQHETIQGILEDQEGNFWITTYSALCRYNPTQGTRICFDQRDGLESLPFNSPATLQTRSGHMYVGGIHGFNKFHPDSIAIQNSVPEALITDFRILGTSISYGVPFDERSVLNAHILDASMVDLTYEDYEFTFQFASNDLTLPQKVQYAYQLEGFDQTWRYTAPGEHTATYTNLRSGTYPFKVKASDLHGNWGQMEHTIMVSIRPPFWEQAWFKIGVAALLGVLIFVWVRLVIDRQEKLHQKKALETERQLLKLKNEKLRSDNISKTTQLTTSAMAIAHKNQVLNGVKNKLAPIMDHLAGDSRVGLQSIIRGLDQEIRDDDSWTQFQMHFDEVHQHFIQKLKSRHPQLTRNDLRMCSLIHIHLSSKEIASILNISVRGVEKSRYRLKKKLDLGPDDNLTDYISNLG